MSGLIERLRLHAKHGAPLHGCEIANEAANALEAISIYTVEEDDRVWLLVNGTRIARVASDSEKATALLKFDAMQRAKPKGES